jgi:biopolymer transport protein ExbB
MSKPKNSPKNALRKTVAAVLLLGVAVPSVSFAWWNNDWLQKRQVTLNAGPVAGLTEAVKRAPVLVRLHSGVFDFTQAKPDGSDLRFVAGDDKTPLNYHIERYDSVAELGLIWVDVPSVAPGATQDIWLYAGNASAQVTADPALTYDGEQSLVLHFNEGAAPRDVTANKNAVTIANATPTLEGLIAGGEAMTAASQIRIAASPSLTIAPGGQMTWSAWIKPSQDAQAPDVAIYTKLGSGGDVSPERLSVGLKNGAAYVRLGANEAVATAALPGGTWAHLAVTADDKTVTLYVNGVAAGTFAATLPGLSGDEVIGTINGVPGFVGDLDEVGRANTARSASQIALLNGSQSRSASFATVASEAETAGEAEHDHFRVLIGALTPDAWVVIGLLGIMAVISWYVMISKGLLFGRTLGANRQFMSNYRAATKGQGAHAGLVSTDIAQQTPDSSLARLFDVGQQELRERYNENRSTGSAYAIAPQSVAAIRSAMDAAHVREEQRLGKWMVLLTIAISGGPFIGLLGTVLGVMITFAAIAAVGEVNVTAIAPGIAAALLATVAGLAVAIPALFGYNYLTSQLETLSTDNQAFVDELEKRIAETYRDTAAKG